MVTWTPSRNRGEGGGSTPGLDKSEDAPDMVEGLKDRAEDVGEGGLDKSEDASNMEEGGVDRAEDVLIVGELDKSEYAPVGREGGVDGPEDDGVEEKLNELRRMGIEVRIVRE